MVLTGRPDSMALRAPDTKKPQHAVVAAYYFTLVLFLLASFFPGYRVWGINWWSYYPVYVPWLLFAIAAAVPLALRYVRIREDAVESRSTYPIVAGGLIVLFGLAFYFLRARTHFLGDGYTLLSQLASQPIIKPRELGEMLVHVWVKSLIGSHGEQAALLTFQIISITAGILFLISVALAARWLFERMRDRILFVLGLASGGYMLLFFGYVENYSLFVLSVAVYSLLGLLIVKGKINRFVIVPALALAVFFHLLGVTLIPSAVYLLAVNSRVGNTIGRLGVRIKLLFVALLAIIAAAVCFHFYSTDYFFRFAVLPLLENRFTAEGYTLFSLRHIADYLNLLMVLLPGLAVGVVTVLYMPLREMIRQKEYRYLLILLLSTLGAVFIFDPKLGMPRDWDLFSYAGVPLTILCFHGLLDYGSKAGAGTRIVLLSVLLGLLTLFPRVNSQVNEDISAAHHIGHIELDEVKNRPARVVLFDIFGKSGKSDKVARLHHRWENFLRNEKLFTTAVDYIGQLDYKAAIPLLYQFLRLYPQAHEAWQKLGLCYLKSKQYDSALVCLHISEGMNPYNARTLYYLGVAHYERGQYEYAKALFLKAPKGDSFYLLALGRLGQCYSALGKVDSAQILLQMARSVSPADVKALYEIGVGYFDDGSYDKAEEFFLKVLDKDSLHFDACNALANVYTQIKDPAKYTAVLLRMARLNDASLELLKRVGEYYLKLSDYHNAAQAYQRASAQGLDSTQLTSVLNKYPQLRELMMEAGSLVDTASQ